MAGSLAATALMTAVLLVAMARIAHNGMPAADGREYAVNEPADINGIIITLKPVKEVGGARVGGTMWAITVTNNTGRVVHWRPVEIEAEDEIGNVYPKVHFPPLPAEAEALSRAAIQPGGKTVDSWLTDKIIRNGKNIRLRVNLPSGGTVRFVVRPGDIE